ncbi:MAG: folate-binding protein YgfZ [Acidimicrobiaceae bacterium]|nr:folate-binding protein YgfZ [Acidimicrobiaceae bacterium]
MTATVAALVPRDVVRTTGADATTFLQGQISQDVEAVEPGDSAWSLVLAPQGKVDAWFRLTRLGQNEFLVDLDAGFAEALVARLERFKLRVDATFEILEGWQMLSIRGSSGSSDGLDAFRAELRAAVAWPGFEGVDLLGPEVSLPAGAEASAAAMEAARIRAGWPAMGRELTERTIPAEIAGLVESSVSFTKGCYTGQELVARIDSRGGNVPRPVRLLEIRGDGVSPGAGITVDGKAVGEITSAAADPDAPVTVALGPVHRRVEPPASAEVDGIPATVLATPASSKLRGPAD